MVRGISMARTVSAARVTCIETGTKSTAGITNVTELTAGVSCSWQQSIEQSLMPAIFPAMLCPQSSCEPAESAVGITLLL